jgi:hypothetical protein
VNLKVLPEGPFSSNFKVQVRGTFECQLECCSKRRWGFRCFFKAQTFLLELSRIDHRHCGLIEDAHLQPARGASIPGYPSLTVGYPTEFQKGGIDIPPGVKMLGCQLAQAGYWPSNCRNYGRQVH